MQEISGTRKKITYEKKSLREMNPLIRHSSANYDLGIESREMKGSNLSYAGTIGLDCQIYKKYALNLF